MDKNHFSDSRAECRDGVGMNRDGHDLEWVWVSESSSPPTLLAKSISPEAGCLCVCVYCFICDALCVSVLLSAYLVVSSSPGHCA